MGELSERTRKNLSEVVSPLLSTQTPSAPDLQTVVRRFSGEDVFLAVFIVATLAAAVAVALPLKGPPVVVATFLAVAVSTLVYRFLGGIAPNTTVTFKAFRVTGSLAALVGLYVLFNSNLVSWLEAQKPVPSVPPLFSVDEVTGVWVHTYPEKGWRAEYTFTKGGPEGFTITGTIKKVTENSSVSILQVTEGTGHVSKDGLELSVTMTGVKGSDFAGMTLHEKTTAPLLRQRATRGTWDVTLKKGNAEWTQRWGLSLAKVE